MLVTTIGLLEATPEEACQSYGEYAASQLTMNTLLLAAPNESWDGVYFGIKGLNWFFPPYVYLAPRAFQSGIGYLYDVVAHEEAHVFGADDDHPDTNNPETNPAEGLAQSCVRSLDQRIGGVMAGALD